MGYVQPSNCRSQVYEIPKQQIDTSWRILVGLPTIKEGIYVTSFINLNLTETDFSDKDTERTQKKQYAELIATLEHECTHVSQKINGMLNFYYSWLKSQNISQARMSTHQSRPQEWEAVLIELFSLIKNTDTVHSAHFFRTHMAYIGNNMSYKTFLKKAADYGLTNSDISIFKQYLANVPIINLEKIFSK